MKKTATRREREAADVRRAAFMEGFTFAAGDNSRTTEEASEAAETYAWKQRLAHRELRRKRRRDAARKSKHVRRGVS